VEISSEFIILGNLQNETGWLYYSDDSSMGLSYEGETFLGIPTIAGSVLVEKKFLLLEKKKDLAAHY
jgi:hypothetical protein